MPTRGLGTTAPNTAQSVNLANQVPALAFVVVWYPLEPHRVGEVAFLTPFVRYLIGRGDLERLAQFLKFAKQQPGEPFPELGWESCVGGDGVSRAQLEACASPVDIEIKIVGKCETLVNLQVIDPKECPTVTLVPGDTIMFRNELVLLCVRRPLTIPVPRGEQRPHRFGDPDRDGYVGESPAAYQIQDDLERAARTNKHVLILGESGTGKEKAGFVVHDRSSRRSGPYVTNNAANSTESLTESELFGIATDFVHAKTRARDGIVGGADGGTIFLDEIGDLPMQSQAQLLRVLETGDIKRAGDPRERKVDVRFVGATNRDESTLRGDFHARLTTRVCLPPLRERREDIALLIRHLVLKRERENPDLAARFIIRGPDGELYARTSGRLVDYLVRQPLSRNVRELNAMLEEAMDASPGDTIQMIFDESSGTTSSIPPTPPRSSVRPAPSSSVPTMPPVSSGKSEEEPKTPRRPSTLTREEIVDALARSGGSLKGAARLLDVDRPGLYRMMKKFGITGWKD